MARPRVGYLTGIVVALGVLGGSAAALALWGRGLSRPKHFGAPTSSISPLPSTAMIRPLGRETTELHAIMEAFDAEDPPRPRNVGQMGPFPATPVDAKLPRLRNSPLSEARDDETDRLLASLVDPSGGRRAFQTVLERGSKIRPEVERVLAAWKIPEDLIAIVIVESAFATSAEGDDRAGLWGLGTPESDAYGIYISAVYDERRAVVTSSEVAAHFLRDLHDRLGTWEFAIAAFGSGYPRAVAIAEKAGGLSFWTLAASGRVPADVLGYVRRVIAVSLALTNADMLKVPVPPSKPAPTSDLEVPSGTPLSTVAGAAGISLSELRDLNPEYLEELVPETEFPMYVHLPSASMAGARELLMPLLTARSGSGLAASPRAAGSAAGGSSNTLGVGKKAFYRVREGDTLASVALHFGVSANRIAADNALSTSPTLRPGMLLVVRHLDTDPSRPDASR